MLGLIVGLKELLKYLTMILGLLGVVVFFIYPVFEGWRPDRVYSRKNWPEYTLGVWMPEKGLMTLTGKWDWRFSVPSPAR